MADIQPHRGNLSLHWGVIRLFGRTTSHTRPKYNLKGLTKTIKCNAGFYASVFDAKKGVTRVSEEPCTAIEGKCMFHIISLPDRLSYKSEHTKKHILLNEIETILCKSVSLIWYKFNWNLFQGFDSTVREHWCSLWLGSCDAMMTSSNGNIFRFIGPFCREFTGHQWIPLTKASDAELWYLI